MNGLFGERADHFTREASMVNTKSGCIRAVTFDVGGTLIECCPSVGHIYAEVAGRH